MQNKAVISGSAVWNPPHVITNEELIDSYNEYVEKFNSENAAQIVNAFGDNKHFPFR